MSDMIFKFGEQELLIAGTAEKPEWRAKDVVDILYPESEPSSRNKYIEKVPPKWKGKKKILTPGGEQEFTTLLEPGLYYLVIRSNSPLAIPFQEWLFEEVMPTIRKTGRYELNASLANENALLKRKSKQLNARIPEGALTLGSVAKMHGLNVEDLLQILAENAEMDIIKNFCQISQRQRILKSHLKKIEELVDEHRRIYADSFQLDLLDV